MIENDLISVIIPVYNVEQYLEECIDSVLAQTYKNIEVILVDDGSTDNSGKLCDDLINKDNRIIVYHKTNGGTATARNLGLDKSKGSLIAFIDSDDIIHPDYLSGLFKTLKKYNSNFSFCFFATFYNEKLPEFKNIVDIPMREVAFNEFYSYDFYCRGSVSACCKLFKRSIFDNYRFIEGKHYEDEYFLNWLYESKIDHISYFAEPLYFYRQRENSKMHTVVTDLRRIYISCALLERIEIDKTNIEKSFIKPSLAYINKIISLRKWPKKYNRDFKKIVRKMSRYNLKFNRNFFVKIKSIVLIIFPQLKNV